MVTLNPQPPTWATPLCFFVLIGATSTTAAATCGISGVSGVKNIVKRDGTPLAVGDLVQHVLHLLVYDGSQLRVLTLLPSEMGTGDGGGGGPPPPFVLDLFIDAPTTYTVGGPGTPNFADLQIAGEFLSKHIITNNGSVLLQLQAGVQNYTANLYLDHANADRITIAGAMTGGCRQNGWRFR